MTLSRATLNLTLHVYVVFGCFYTQLHSRIKQSLEERLAVKSLTTHLGTKLLLNLRYELVFVELTHNRQAK